MSTFQDLPNEIVSKIITFIPPSDLEYFTSACKSICLLARSRLAQYRAMKRVYGEISGHRQYIRLRTGQLLAAQDFQNRLWQDPSIAHYVNRILLAEYPFILCNPKTFLPQFIGLHDIEVTGNSDFLDTVRTILEANNASSPDGTHGISQHPYFNRLTTLAVHNIDQGALPTYCFIAEALRTATLQTLRITESSINCYISFLDDPTNEMPRMGNTHFVKCEEAMLERARRGGHWGTGAYAWPMIQLEAVDNSLEAVVQSRLKSLEITSCWVNIVALAKILGKTPGLESFVFRSNRLENDGQQPEIGAVEALLRRNVGETLVSVTIAE